MFSLTITAGTSSELRAKVRDYLGLDAEAGPTPGEVIAEVFAEAKPDKKPRKPRATGAARKSELQASVATPVVEEAEVVAESQVERSQVENAARAFAAKNGVAKAKELIAQVAPGAGRVTDVPDNKLTELYDAIQAAS